MSFNINAQVILSGPKNLTKVRSSIKKQLTGINVPIKLELPKGVSKRATTLTTNIQKLEASILRLNTTATAATISLSKLSVVSKTLAGASNTVAKSSQKAASKVAGVGKAAQASGSAMHRFGKDAAQAIRRFAAFTIATTLVFGFVRAVTQGISQGIKFQREMVKIAQVVGNTAPGMKGLRNEIDNLSTSLGVSSSELQGVARTFAQTGQSIKEIKASIKAVARASLSPTFDTMANSAEGVIAALAQFKLGAEKAEAVLGSLNAVSKRFAVEASDLISVIRRAGGVFAAATEHLGGPEERLSELIGIFTAVRSTTRESADTIATGLRTIFSRLQRPKTIIFLENLGVQLRATAADAKRLGIAEGEFVGIYEALRKVSQILPKLGGLEVAQLVEELGGIRQVGKLIPALRNFEKAEKARGVAMRGTASISADVALATKTLSVQIANTQEKFAKLMRTISESSTFKSITKQLLFLADSLIAVASALTPLLPAITMLAGLKLSKMGAAAVMGFMGKAPAAARAVGSTVVGAATGKGSGSSTALTAAIKANTTATLANTKHLDANTVAIGTLTKRLGLMIGGRPTRKAAGGTVPGIGSGDTVPALLTPGEFVINKKSASRLGASNLHSMNRFGKGGSVGNVQKLAGGGFAAGGLNAFFGAQMLMSMDFSEETGDAKANIINLAFAMLLLADPIKSLAGQVTKLSSTTAGATKGLTGFGAMLGKTDHRIAKLGLGMASGQTGPVKDLAKLLKGGKAGFLSDRKAALRGGATRAGARFDKKALDSIRSRVVGNQAAALQKVGGITGMKKKATAMAGQNLQRAGVTRTIDKKGRASFRRAGGFISKADVQRIAREGISGRSGAGALMDKARTAISPKRAGQMAVDTVKAGGTVRSGGQILGINKASRLGVMKRGATAAVSAFNAAKGGKTFGVAAAKSLGKAIVANKGNLIAAFVSIFAAGVAGAVATGVHGRKQSLEGIEERGRRRTGSGRAASGAGISAMGGALGGAAAGASLGAMTGPAAIFFVPLFAGIGAVVGGLTSFSAALKEQAIFEQFDGINTAAERLTKNLDRLDKKGIENAGALNSVTRASNNLVKTFNTNIKNIVGLRTGQLAAGSNFGPQSVGGTTAAGMDSILGGANTLSQFGLLFGTGQSGQQARETVSSDSLFGGRGRMGVRIGQAQQLLGGGDFSGRAIGAQTVGTQRATAKAVTQGLNLIDDADLERAEQKANELQQAIIDSIPLDQLTVITSMDTGAGFNDLISSLEEADSSSKVYAEQLKTLAALQGVVALKDLKAFTERMNKLKGEIDPDAAGGVEQRNIIDMGIASAAAYQQGLAKGKSPEEAGKLAKAQFIQGLTGQAGAAGFDASNTDLLKDISFKGMQAEFKALDSGSGRAEGRLNELADALNLDSIAALRLQFDALEGQMQDNTIAIMADLAANRALERSLFLSQRGVMALGAALDGFSSGFSTIMSDISVGTDNFAQSANAIMSIETGMFDPSRKNVFAGGGAGRSAAELQTGISQVGAFAGLDTTATKGFAEAINLQNTLPQIMKDAIENMTEDMSPDDVIEDIKKRMGPGFSQLPDVVKTQFEANMTALTKGANRQENMGESGVDQMKEALETGEFEDILSETGDKIAQVFDELAQAQDNYTSILNKSAEVQLALSKQERSTRQGVTNLRQKFDFSDRPRNAANDRLDRVRATLGSQTTVGTGPTNMRTVGSSLNATSLLEDRKFLEDSLQTTREEKARGGQSPDEMRKASENETQLVDALNSNKLALEQLSEDTSHLEAIQNKIAAIESTKQTKEQRLQTFLTQMAGAKSPEEAAKIERDFMRPVEAFEKAQAGQALTPQDIAAMRQDLSQKDGKIQLQFGLTDEQVKAEGEKIQGVGVRSAVAMRQRTKGQPGAANITDPNKTFESQFGFTKENQALGVQRAAGAKATEDQVDLKGDIFEITKDKIQTQQTEYGKMIDANITKIGELKAEYDSLIQTQINDTIEADEANLAARQTQADLSRQANKNESKEAEEDIKQSKRNQTEARVDLMDILRKSGGTDQFGEGDREGAIGLSVADLKNVRLSIEAGQGEQLKSQVGNLMSGGNWTQEEREQAFDTIDRMTDEQGNMTDSRKTITDAKSTTKDLDKEDQKIQAKRAENEVRRRDLIQEGVLPATGGPTPGPVAFTGGTTTTTTLTSGTTGPTVPALNLSPEEEARFNAALASAPAGVRNMAEGDFADAKKWKAGFDKRDLPARGTLAGTGALSRPGGIDAGIKGIQELTAANNTFSSAVPELAAALQGGLNVNIDGSQKPIEVILNGGGLQNILNQETLDMMADAVAAKLRGNGPRPDGKTTSPDLTA